MVAPPAEAQSQRKALTSEDIGALAHLYRAEIYRSTIWRTRLDTTTNWSVVTLGIALSITYSSAKASAVPLVLVGILITFFLILESRRYRYFNVWRARARWMERHFYGPMLTDAATVDENWQDTLAKDYLEPHYHISFVRAVGRRLRRNYVWILLIQTIAYAGKIIIHPTPVASFAEFLDRATIGPFPGAVVLICGILYNVVWIATALWTLHLDRVTHRTGRPSAAMG
jgi:uncharacterized membrane protein